MTEIECEVLRRHDRYVVRRVGTEEYACREYIGALQYMWKSVRCRWLAHNFRSRRKAIRHAKLWEADLKRDALYAEKVGKEERVWR